MPTDPFVSPELPDAPRQETNLAPGVHLPAAKAWRADRPGDLVAGQPTGTLLGRPGPNVGYAMTLAARLADRISLAPHESAHDALAVISELGMKRAASFGRAPTMADVEAAATLLGYLGEVDPEFAAWRATTVHGAEHEYGVRRAIVDAVPDAVLRLPPQVAGLLDEFRASLRQHLEE
jgi:hypothetical protein